MKQVQVEQEQKGWVSRVNTGLQMRAAGEAMVSKALRERLDKVGEREWLQECQDEWGWAERTAYRHLNPEGMEKLREENRDRQAAVKRQVEPEPAAAEEKKETPKRCEMPSAEHDVAAGIMNLNSVLEEGEFTVQGLRELVVGTGKWKIHRELKRLISTLTELQKELEK